MHGVDGYVITLSESGSRQHSIWWDEETDARVRWRPFKVLSMEEGRDGEVEMEK